MTNWTGVALLCVTLGACSSEQGGSTNSVGGSGGIGGTPTPAGSAGSGGLTIDPGSIDASGTAGSADGTCTESDLPATDAMLAGTVYAPNLTLPISGALVYLTRGAVEPVPERVYCAECVKLGCSTRYALTQADGSFQLPAVSGVGWKLVVQKGQFLRVSALDVAPGTNMVGSTLSNLPGKWDPAQGMWIPKIAVYDAEPDIVSNVLAKLGMGTVTDGQLDPGTEPFTLIQPESDMGSFMDNLEAMSAYHIVFVPCAATKYWNGAPTVPEARAQNIRDYVAAGGKWYATDHSNEYIAEPFPTYQSFHTQDGDPDLQPAYDVESTVVDPDLQAWLSALPPALKDIGNGYPTLGNLPKITTQLNYSGLDSVHDILVPNAKGEMMNVGHHTWVKGPCTSCSDPDVVRPMAVTGQFGCGRMMYSTFETSSTTHEGMSPQELVLLFMILEIGVCHEEPPPDPPSVK